jgi:hypothetical protein
MREGPGRPYGPVVPRNPQGMTDWITHRLPTELDACSQGLVLIQQYKDGLPRNVGTLRDCSRVVPGQPWWSQRAKSVDQMFCRVGGGEAAEAQPAPKPDYSDPMEQARLEHLRAQTLLLQAQAYALSKGEPHAPSIDLASMSNDDLHLLQQAATTEFNERLWRSGL